MIIGVGVELSRRNVSIRPKSQSPVSNDNRAAALSQPDLLGTWRRWRMLLRKRWGCSRPSTATPSAAQSVTVGSSSCSSSNLGLGTRCLEWLGLNEQELFIPEVPRRRRSSSLITSPSEDGVGAGSGDDKSSTSDAHCERSCDVFVR